MKDTSKDEMLYMAALHGCGADDASEQPQSIRDSSAAGSAFKTREAAVCENVAELTGLL
jgi:hypothetical protein